MRPVSVGILSIGDMGLGVAKLLVAHGYRVLTVGEGRRYEFDLYNTYCYVLFGWCPSNDT